MIAPLAAPRPDTTIPSAPARLVRGKKYWLWRVARCPRCGGPHQHGGGELAGDPRRLLTHRVADCGLGGYILVEEGGES